MQSDEQSRDIVICALYKFTKLEDYKLLRNPLLRLMEAKKIKGSLLLAKEGINGTVSGNREAIDYLLKFLNQNPCLAPVDYKESYATKQPFLRTKVKLKKEIVTMGVENIDPTTTVGTYVDSEQWNKLILDPDVTVIDTRNDYEITVGTFKNAINPNTTCFREFVDYADKNLDNNKQKKIAMFCTGGIRCEKSTAYLKQQGFAEVYHLKGGILKYLEETPEDKSLWQGECYVFDQRVTVNHNLEPGSYDQCNACRMPITEADKASTQYEKGVSCPKCIDQSTEKQKKRFLEREKQMILAKKRGMYHMGNEVQDTVKQRRDFKQLQKVKSRSKQQSPTSKNIC